jgi:NAD(P)-dependent dehydrogenase (short-subunit alcohol dehydrogenase family)
VLKGRGLIPPASVSNAVLYLASDESSDVTGVALPVDGGHGVLPGYNGSPIVP